MSNGRSVGGPVTEPPVTGPLYCRLTREGRLVAVARQEDDELKPEVVLA